MNRVVPAEAVVDEAVALAERILDNSPTAVRVVRRLVKESVGIDEAAAWALTRHLAGDVLASGDAIEGATAFAEKRTPTWNEDV